MECCLHSTDASLLDPQATFRVYSPMTRVRTGEAARLRLFANRTNAPIQYKWIVEGRPEGSTATVENARGTVQKSTPFEYHYLKNNVARFTADEPGEYRVKLAANLVFPDTVNANFPRTSNYLVTIVAEGDSMGGCSMGGGSTGAGIGFLMLLGLLFIRRRK